MIKNIFIFLIILLSLSTVKADTIISNANTTSIHTYDNNTVDTHYFLNSTDSLTYFKISYELYRTNIPYTITFIFNDKRNNTLIVSDLYSYNNYYGLIPYITKTKTAYLNNQQLFFYNTNAWGNNATLGSTNIPNYSENFYVYDYFSDTSSFNDKIEFSSNKVVYETGISTKYRNVLNSKLFINEIILPNNTNIQYTNIYLEYQDNSVSMYKNDIDNAYNSMNPVFKLIFLLFKGGTLFLSGINIITDSQMYDYQYYFITPLSYIDYAIKLFFSTLKFISTMGLLWVFLIIESIIFIVNWIKTGDIIDTITDTLSDSKSVWDVLLIKPLNWIYTKLMLFWTSK